MVTYWTTCFISMALTWVTTHIKQRHAVYFMVIAAFLASMPLIFISAVRDNVGADYITYYRYYVDILNGGGRERFEILYYLLNKVIAFFGADPIWLFGAAAILFLVPIYIRSMRDSPYPTVSVFLLVGMTYYFYFLNATRQMVAAAILLFSVPLIEKKNFWLFACFVLTAVGFHTMSIVFIFLYFLVRMNFGVKSLAVLTIIFFVFSQTIGSLGNAILSQMTYYSAYLDSAYADRGQGYIVLAMNILITIFCTVFYDKGNTLFKIYYTMQVVSLWVSALNGTIVLIDRFRMIFGLADIILIPMAIQQIHNRWLRIGSIIAIVLLYFIYASYTVGVQNSNMVLPYQTVFN